MIEQQPFQFLKFERVWLIAAPPQSVCRCSLLCSVLHQMDGESGGFLPHNDVAFTLDEGYVEPVQNWIHSAKVPTAR
jgi:hypothetical protein